MNAPNPVSSDPRVWWLISVTNYGRFEYFGTEAEADQMRKDKAEWEGGRGSKRLATADESARGLDWLKFQQGMGYRLDEREMEALT